MSPPHTAHLNSLHATGQAYTPVYGAQYSVGYFAAYGCGAKYSVGYFTVLGTALGTVLGTLPPMVAALSTMLGTLPPMVDSTLVVCFLFYAPGNLCCMATTWHNDLTRPEFNWYISYLWKPLRFYLLSILGRLDARYSSLTIAGPWRAAVRGFGCRAWYMLQF